MEIYYKDKLIDEKSFMMGPVSINLDDKALAEIRPLSSPDKQQASYLSKLWSDNTTSPVKKTVAILALRGSFSSSEGIAAITAPLAIDLDYPDESKPRIERYGDRKVVRIGLFLSYNSILFDANSRQIVFQKSGQISALPERAIFGISKIDYASDEIEVDWKEYRHSSCLWHQWWVGSRVIRGQVHHWL